MDQNQKILNYLRKTFVGKQHRVEMYSHTSRTDNHLDFVGIEAEYYHNFFILYIRELDTSDYSWVSSKPLMAQLNVNLHEYLTIDVIIANINRQTVFFNLRLPDYIKAYIGHKIFESTMKRNIIISEAQAKRLFERIINEQANLPKPGATPANGPAAAAAAPVSDVSAPEQGDTDGLPASDASADPLNPPVPGGGDSASGPVSGDAGGDMSAGGGGGGAIGGAGDPFGDGGAGADANSKVSVWNSGINRGPANKLGTEGPWSQNISRGKANPLQSSGPWQSGVSRGKSNPIN